MSMRHKQVEMLEKMRDILGDDFLVLKALAYQLDEDFDTGQSHIRLKVVNESNKNTVLVFEGEGAGLVDACFHGLLAAFAEQYPSLKSITFQDFSVKGIMTTGDASHSNAEAQVDLRVLSSEQHEFSFSAQSLSVGRASVDATLQAVSYFVNSEQSFIRTYNLLKHHRHDNRPDLVTKYQLLLGQMVQNTSYTEVIEQIKNELRG